METKERIERLIAKNNAQIKSCKDNLEENFVFHFEWLAETLFKLEWKNKMLEYILSLFNDADVNVEDSIKRLKERFKEELITRTLMDSSTNPVANLASLWVNECKQDLIAEL